jgi:hypothetical protein
VKIYPKALESFLKGDLDLDGNIKALLVSSSYTQNDAHDNLDDVAAGRLGLSANLASKTMTNGTFDAADPTISVTANGTGNAVILFLDTGTESTSKLIAYIDKAADGTTALSRPVLNGDTVTVQVHASGFFDL